MLIGLQLWPARNERCSLPIYWPDRLLTIFALQDVGWTNGTPIAIAISMVRSPTTWNLSRLRAFFHLFQGDEVLDHDGNLPRVISFVKAMRSPCCPLSTPPAFSACAYVDSHCARFQHPVLHRSWTISLVWIATMIYRLRQPLCSMAAPRTVLAGGSTIKWRLLRRR